MDLRIIDVIIVRDHGSAKLGAKLHAALKSLNLKIIEMDLPSASSEKEQAQFLNKFGQGSHVFCLVFGLTLITNYWSQLQSFVKRYTDYSPSTVVFVWYNVSKEMALGRAEDLRRVPDCEFSEADDADSIALGIRVRVKGML